MKIKNSILIIIGCALIHSLILAQPLPFKKVIIWGHKLHSHTHSYIHFSFHKTFKHLGYDTLWLDKNDDTSCIDFSNSLFITEGQVDQNIPLREDCRYILHNCNPAKYKKLFDQNLCIILQVYSHDCLKRKETKIDDCMHINIEQKTIYMPWATDLLPDEIDEMKKQLPSQKRQKAVYWIGTVGGGVHGNQDQLDPFAKACRENHVKFQHITHAEQAENIDLICKSYMAPAIQGKWQCDNGYVPCRIFKNISYGQMGITNSKTIYDLFKGKIVYNEDTHQLFYDAKKRLKNMDINEMYDLMDFVKTKHTYINRIESLLDFLNYFKPLK
ncbi:MAG: hypothetical protein P4L31_06070 [Candidatus Babeliales bacterium]|nr:hypothetical protein [Candidatus Babeliales bacterium]